MSTPRGEDHAGGYADGRPLPAAGSSVPGPGLLLGHDVGTGQDVWLPDETRLRGVTVVGKTGTGKSRLLERLLVDDLRRGTPAVVIDPHGRLVSRVLSLAPPRAADRLILLEPWPDRPWRLNLLHCPDLASDTAVDRTVDHVVEVFKKLFDRSADYLPRLERDLDAAVRTVLPNRGTLLDVLRLFSDDGLWDRYRGAVTDPAVGEYWDFFARLGREAERARQVEATVNRLYRLLAPRLIRRIVDTPTTTVPFDAVLADDRMLLLSIPAGELTGQRCDFVGALFLAALTDRIFARQAATADPGRLHLYIDEYARFATPMTAELFAEGRKYGVGLTVAHQTLAQIPDAANRAAERQVGALVCFQLTGPDAEELAAEFDTTPTRTKKTMRQRTRPVFKEWDEEFWDSPEAEADHAAVEAQLATLKDTVGAALARRTAGYAILERAYWPYRKSSAYWPDRESGAFDALLAGTLDELHTHRPFNPVYFMHIGWGETVGGLRKVGEPDFWDPDHPAELRCYPCEGYLLTKGKDWFRQSRLVDELDHYHGPFEDVRWDVQQQVTAMLDREYREAIFWFCPGTLDRARIHSKPNRLPDETAKELAEQDTWVFATTPKLGRERPPLLVRWVGYRAYGGRVGVKAVPGFNSKQWPDLGWWQLTAFPRAVAWLKQWIRDARRDIGALQAELDAKLPPLEERLSSLVQTHFKKVHHKKYLGDLPDQHISWWTSYRTQYTRARVVQEPINHKEAAQWYDPVEELDQTHADRRLELANQLAHLPPLTVYYRTPTGQHQVALPRTSEAALDEARIAAIRQESRARFGRSPQPPTPAAPPSENGSAPSGPPPLRRIGRQYPDEP